MGLVTAGDGKHMGLVAKTPGAGTSPPPEPPGGAGALVLTDEGGTLRIANRNTTIGYLRYAAEPPAIEYIFVHPAFRRQGHAARLVRALEAKLGRPCPPEPPLSPLGQAFFRALGHTEDCPQDHPAASI